MLLPFGHGSEFIGVRAAAEASERPAPEFADVYKERLAPVWRYVRSRIPDYHEAQDVTSDVFVRAWRGWPRFDPRRGEVGPWLFGIAHRAVVDWLRKEGGDLTAPSGEEAFMDGAGESPEGAVLREELLVELGVALRSLNGRERDALALRFAARLRMAEVGEVLGASTGAAKMIVSRAVARLAEAMSRRPRTDVEQSPVVLDDVIEDVLERAHPAISGDRLRELLYHLAVVHQPPMPPELHRRVAWCVECDSTKERKRHEARRAGDTKLGDRKEGFVMRGVLARLGFPSPSAVGWSAAMSPICIGCTVQAALAPLTALGVGLGVLFPLHVISLVTAPVVLFLVWRRYRRHRDRVSLWVAAAGAMLVATHLITHFVAEGSAVFTVSDRVGAALLVAATLLDWRAMRRWMSRQRRGVKLLQIEAAVP